jgi:hypothetical protein
LRRKYEKQRHCFQATLTQPLELPFGFSADPSVAIPPVAMRPVQFDSFGEPVPQAIDQEQTAASRIALRSGVGLFWAAVVAIVAARAIYFDPDFAERFSSVAALVGHVRTIVGV